MRQEDKDILIARQRDHLEGLNNAGVLRPKSCDVNTMLERWIDVVLPIMTTESQASITKHLPYNNPTTFKHS